MKKIGILVAVVVVMLIVWNKSQQGGDGALADLSRRLDAAEQSFAQAGRAAGVSGADTSADAASALAEVEEVERELRGLDQASPSSEDEHEIDRLLSRVEDLKRKMS